MFPVFLSHSGENFCEVIAVRDWLKENGWNDVVSEFDQMEGSQPTNRWERALQEDIARCEAVVFLISRSWLSSERCRYGFWIARKLGKRIFCALVENLSIQELPAWINGAAQTLALASGEDHRLFRVTPPGDHDEREVAFSTQALGRLKDGLTQARLDPLAFAWPFENEPDRAPYRGLQPLQDVDAGIFFGRDESLIEAIDTLRQLAEAPPGRLFVILGAPGAGKSSFLRAGLWPRLARDDHHFLPLPVIQAEGAVVYGASGFAPALAGALESRGLEVTPKQIREAITGGVDALRPLLRDLARRTMIMEAGATSPTLVIVIDQAEELFRANGALEGENLLTLLGDLAKADDPAIIVLFAMRSDSYDALQRAKPFARFRQRIFALPPMSRGAYQSVIERPLERVTQAERRFEIEPALTEDLLDDIDQIRGDPLPLLALTLEQLYRACGQEKCITRVDYEKFGRLAGSIDAAVGRVFAIAGTDPYIPKDHEARLALLRRGLIPWMACVDPKTGTARRRIARPMEIPEESRALIELLVEERLVTRGADKITGEATLELAHETVLRHWKLLKGWVADEPRLDLTLDDLKRASRDWEAHTRSRVWAKHGGEQLEKAERLYTQPEALALLDSTDRAYLLACQEKEKAGGKAEEVQRIAEPEPGRDKSKKSSQQAQKAPRLAWFSSIGMAAALVVATLAGWQWQRAAKAKREAQTHSSRAEKALALATDAANQLMVDLAEKLRNASGAQASLITDIVTRASKLDEQLIFGDAHSNDLRRSQSVALNHIVETRLAMGDTKGTLAAARQSVALMEALSTSNPRDTGWRRDLSVSYEKLGDVQAAEGDFAGALKSYRDDLTIAEAISASDPASAQWRWDLSVSYEKLGDVQLAHDDVEGALESYRNDRAIREALSASNPGSVAWRRDLAVSYERVGATLAKQHDVKSAITAFEGALDIYQSLARANPDDVQALAFSVVPHWRLADLDRARAREHLEAALTILERLAAADRLTEQRRGWIATIRAALDQSAPASKLPGSEPATQ